MNTQIKLIEFDDCKLAIVGEDLYDSSQNSTQLFSYDKTITINTIYKVSSSEEETFITHLIDYHEDKSDVSLNKHSDEVVLDLKEDGLYKIVHTIVPVKGSVETLPYNNIFVYDNGKLHKYDVYSGYSEIDINEMLLVNPTEDVSIAQVTDYTFVTCKLKACFYDICSTLLSSLCPNSCDKTKYSQLIYNRDLVWMAINIIKYLLELGKPFEALNVLEQLEGCNGICPFNKFTKGDLDCGCKHNN